MIRKWTYGHPMDTDAVVLRMPAAREEMPYFTVTQTEGSVTFSLTLDELDVIYGLGESVRGMNKRGFHYRAWNSDEFNHTEDRQSLYSSHNMLLFTGSERTFGVYFDDPGEMTFDLGFTCRSRAEITSVNGDLEVYILEADTLKGIAKLFRQLTGRSYIPPKWAFGYIQSRWGYAGEEEVRAVVAEHRQRHIPLDSVCLDIDYMVDFKNFTWREDAFPDWRRFNEEMKREHIHLIPIIDAGIKIEEGYEPYESGLDKDVFCRKEDGSLFAAAVWPGRCVFPDFLKPETREWFGELYRPLLEAGIEGFWNDMNEPALFYSDEGLQASMDKVEQVRRGENPSYEDAWFLRSAFDGMANSREDYQRFTHEVNGQLVRHDKVHNLYGAGMTRATAEGMKRFDPKRRMLLFSRSSFIGAHRNGGLWMGDNFSWWSHLKLALQMLPNLNLSGFLYTGCDLGGFGCDTTEDLLIRFLQLGVFMPLMRNHSALHTREQEAYRFETWEMMRDVISVRYALLPYLYSEFMKAALEDGMLFRPLSFDYPEDERAWQVEDQLMWGEDCMIAPVYEQNAEGRYVYLPEDMLMLVFRSATERKFVQMEEGTHYIPLELGEFPLFIKRGHGIPIGRGGEWVDMINRKEMGLTGWDIQNVGYELYDDDGITPVKRIEQLYQLTPARPRKQKK